MRRPRRRLSSFCLAQGAPQVPRHRLNQLLDHAIDWSHFDARFRNDESGATAYPPVMRLKVVLFAHSQGLVSSRGFERACAEHVTFIALSGDTRPHSTTIAHFASTLGEDIARVVAAEDTLPIAPDLAVKAAQRITQLEQDATPLRDWLAAHPADRRGPTGGIRQSDRADNERARMATTSV